MTDEVFTIGESRSWMIADDGEGHAVAVPADDIIDAMIEGATIEQAQEMADKLARERRALLGLDPAKLRRTNQSQ